MFITRDIPYGVCAFHFTIVFTRIVQFANLMKWKVRKNPGIYSAVAHLRVSVTIISHLNITTKKKITETRDFFISLPLTFTLYFITSISTVVFFVTYVAFIYAVCILATEFPWGTFLKHYGTFDGLQYIMCLILQNFVIHAKFRQFLQTAMSIYYMYSEWKHE